MGQTLNAKKTPSHRYRGFCRVKSEAPPYLSICCRKKSMYECTRRDTSPRPLFLRHRQQLAC